jgi:hypothetical protein
MTQETLMTEGQNTTDADQQQAATTTEAAATTDNAAQEQQVAGSTPDAAKPDAKESAPAAPEKYEFTPPDGYEFDPRTIGAFSEVAKELGMPQESAQKILDKMAPAMAEKEAARMEEIRNEWADAAKADKEFGGDKLTDSLASAKKALDAFGSPELKDLLNQSGLGNHPDVIRFMVRAGKAISEDGFVSGARGAGNTASAQNLYSKSNMNP